MLFPDETVVFLGERRLQQREVGRCGVGAKLKVTPRFEMPVPFVMLMRGGPCRSVTVKKKPKKKNVHSGPVTAGHRQPQ